MRTSPGGNAPKGQSTTLSGGGLAPLAEEGRAG